LISEDSFKQVLDLDGWREGMLFAWISRGKSVRGIGLYSRRRRVDNRCPGNTIRTEAGIARQKMRAGLFRKLTSGRPTYDLPDRPARILPIQQKM
jgi:hypothetical protein